MTTAMRDQHHGVIRPVDVLAHQVGLHRWLNTSHGEAYIKAFSENPRRIETPNNLPLLYIARRALVGATYQVSTDMLHLAEHAAAKMPVPITMQASDVPSSTGFLWLGDQDTDSYLAADMNEPPLYFAVKAFSWVQVSNGLQLCCYTDRLDPRDSAASNLAEAWPKLSGPRLIFSHSTPLVFGKPLIAEDYRTGAKVERDPMITMLYTVWRLMQQRVAVTEHGHLDRAATRRASREGIEEPSIRIVTLRRPRQHQTSQEGNGHSVNWSHRWTVDGHWRNQWYPSEDCHKPRWIDLYIKGPEDLPLVTKPTVYKWRR